MCCDESELGTLVFAIFVNLQLWRSNAYETHEEDCSYHTYYLLRLRHAIATLCMDRKAMVQISVFYLSIYKLTTLRLIQHSSSIGILKLFGRAGYPSTTRVYELNGRIRYVVAYQLCLSVSSRALYLTV